MPSRARPPRPRPGPAAWVLVLVLATCACGADGSATAGPTGSASASSPASSPAASGSPSGSRREAEQRRLEAKVVADAPPTGLTWLHPEAPTSWTRLATEDGTLQWRLGSSACAVTLAQPSGVGRAAAPTSQQVVDSMVATVVRTLGASLHPTVVKTGTLMLPARVTGLDERVSVTVVARRVRVGPQVEGLFYGYRSGDFALEFSVVCGKGQYDAVTGTDGFGAFAQGLAVQATY